ncbi:histone H4 [Aspergillus novofumigatus IBT 16806]|uniref:Histone H4 n=1 Tax=Aspergillus novofumigatus (strain IBT 16806) TaxID=1392255 RepID=A0A2I1CIK0_ASPN1|nr:histone H4.2 [Aspergillus novofumigatus IBT 16806]PKX97462.1 histone H4.2 [Aspergillus novofumigatus IBT 16806]
MDVAHLAAIPNTRGLLLKGHRRRFLRDNIMGITKPAIRRLARRGGVVRIKTDIYAEIRSVIRGRLREILFQVVQVLESSKTHRHDRKVVTTRDVVYALQRMGQTMYGF